MLQKLFWELTGPAGVVVAALGPALAAVVGVRGLAVAEVPLALARAVAAGARRSPAAPLAAVTARHRHPDVDGVVIWGGGRESGKNSIYREKMLWVRILQEKIHFPGRKIRGGNDADGGIIGIKNSLSWEKKSW